MKKIWYVLFPLLYYYVIMLIVMTVAQLVLGSGSDRYVLCQLIATVVTLPFLVPLYRQTQALAGAAPQPFRLNRERGRFILLAAAASACLSIGLNNVLTMTPLAESSAAYQKANADFYGGSFVLQILCLAVFTPMLEELVFRGILFGRLLQLLPKAAAVVLSALLFAAVHGNIVQFLYAFVLGIALALLMDAAGNVYAAIAGHMTANLIAVVRTQTGCLDFTVRGDIVSWALALVLLAAGVLLVYFCRRKER